MDKLTKDETIRILHIGVPFSDHQALKVNAASESRSIKAVILDLIRGYNSRSKIKD